MSRNRLVLESLIGVLLLSALLVNGIYALSQHRMQITETVSIHIENDAHAALLHADDVRDLMQTSAGCCEGSRREEINTAVLEENIDNHPLVGKSEVFSTLEGVLYIHAKVKRPTARVMASDTSYYLDDLGDYMPLSSRYAAPVMLVTGSVGSWNRAQLMALIDYVSADAFYASRIAGIHLNDDGEARLYPAKLGFTILLGKGNEMESRLKKLNVFWENALDEDLAQRLKHLDLRFNRQVVCQF